MAHFSVLLLVVLGFSASVALGADYCSLCNGQHTMCKTNGGQKQAACGQAQITPLTDADKTTILNKHNEYRRRIAKGEDNVSNMPNAGNMMELEWDDELATIAQALANTCHYDHDKCRITGDGCYSSVGQNLAVQGSSEKGKTPDWNAAIAMWYDEVKDYRPEWAEKFTSPSSGAVVGHFTQVVWANTHKVGCGYIEFYGSQPLGKNYHNRYYVCNYARGGNMSGGSVYEVGAPCSKCPKNSTCRNSLCKLN